jgi:uncharacterized phiE125 gp8 family phage protein
LRVGNTADDTLLTGLIEVTRTAAEYFMNRSLITQSWKISFDNYAPTRVSLRMGPVQSITSVTLIARDGTSTVMDAGQYYLSSGKRFLIFDANPIAHRVEIVYVTGYGGSSDVPDAIRQGILLHTRMLFDDRNGTVGIPEAARALYVPYRDILL